MEMLQVRAHLGETLLASVLVEGGESRWPVTLARIGAGALAAGALALILLAEPAAGGVAALLAAALVVLGARREPDVPFEVKRTGAGIGLSWLGERQTYPHSALPLSLRSGELRLEVAAVSSPERVPRFRGRDPERRALLGFAAGSVVVHASVVALALSFPTPVRFGLYTQLSRRPARVALVATPPRPGAGGALQLWLAHGGEAMAARRSSRPRGSPWGRGRVYVLRGPRNNPDPHLARRLAEEAARSAGVLSVLGGRGAVGAGTGLADAFGDGDDLGPMFGNQIGEAYGVGGLGLSGTGRGGGGTGQGIEGSGTLGTLGRGGGGGGGGGYGRGVGMLVGTASRCGNEGCIPSVIAGRAESRCGAATRGCLDKEMIRQVVRRHLNEVRYCYQKELQSYPDGLDGRVTVRFEIQPAGTVSSSSVTATTLNVPSIESCLEAAARRWRFPRAPTGGVTVVSYPFYFRTAGR